MLQKIISAQECAECRFCCVFDRDDAWEMPVISDELAGEDCFGSCGFEFSSGAGKVKPQYDAEGIFQCPALGETGCLLASRKPFDCRLWPLRVMHLNGLPVLTLSPFCKAANKKTVSEIQDFIAESGIAALAFAEAEKNTAAIPEYREGYAIFEIKKKQSV
jgi:Fe-S-cluster containining protein